MVLAPVCFGDVRVIWVMSVYGLIVDELSQ